MQTLFAKKKHSKTYRRQIISFGRDNRTFTRYPSMCGHITYTFKFWTQNETRGSDDILERHIIYIHPINQSYEKMITFMKRQAVASLIILNKKKTNKINK